MDAPTVIGSTLTSEQLATFLSETGNNFAAVDFGELPYDHLRIWYNTSYSGVIEIMHSLLDSAYYNRKMELTDSLQLNATFKVLPASAKNPSVVSVIFVLVFCVYVSEGLNFPPVYAAVSAVRERVSQARLQQRLMGVLDVYYWLANFLFDFAVLLPVAVLFLLITLFAAKGLRDAVLAMTVEILLFGWACLPLCYWMSFPYKSASTAENGLLNLMMIPMLLSAVVSSLFSFVPFLQNYETFFSTLFYLVPGYALFDSFKRVSTIFPILTQYGAATPNAWGWDYCGKALVFMAVEGFLFFFCVIFFERKSWVKTGKVTFDATPYAPGDDDVRAEIDRVRAGAKDAAVTVNGVWKVYPGTKKAPAVEACRDVTFAVNEGDCFGLIGPNGAGKTSILSILMGTLGYNQGACGVQGHAIPEDILGAYKVLGYCPQFDVLFDFMTTYECLYFYGMVKGIPEPMLDGVVSTCLRCLGLEQHRDKNTKDLSGGNKRRLCVAIAFMGNPKVVIMDEPSTGLDPVSRRKLWNIIKTSSKARSFLLTTHLMEEADALCNRIAIMVNGQIQCIGSGQHLKTKFGEGYTLDFKLENDEAKMKAFLEMIAKEAGAFETREIHGCHAILVLPNQKPLSFLFRFMEEAREEYKIVDYTLSQTTLDQVFLQFAKNQKEEMPTMTQAELMKTQ